MKLTERQAEVLEFIKDHLRIRDRPPTRMEIAKAFGWASPNAAEDHLRALEKKGAIALVPHKARAIEIVDLQY